jgi:ankyrin repeat protein
MNARKSFLMAMVSLTVFALGGAALGDKIHQAAKSGDLAAVKQLLNDGADVNEKDQNGWTPLHWAAWKGNNEIVVLLLSKGADANARTNHG